MFPHKTSSRISRVISSVNKILCAAVLLMALQSAAAAAGTFVAAPGRVDMVYDSARDILYVTSGGSVLRYQLGSNTFLAPFDLGGNLSGIDLSPDGNTLAVADRQRTESSVRIHLVDLTTGQPRTVSFPRGFGEGGTFTVAFAGDGALLVTSTYEGSGWVQMRRHDPATGATTVLASSITQNTMLASSGDGAVVGFAESNISDGRFGRYRVADANLLRKSGYTDGTGWYNYEIGVNRDGTQYAIPTYGGTFIYDASLVRVGTVGQYAGTQPIGVVYHPVENTVYFAWAGTTQVRAHDTATLAQTAAYDFEHAFTHPGNHAYTQGRLRISRDGSLLFATVSGGVRYLRLYDSLRADDQSVSTDEENSAFVTLSGSVGNGSAVSYQIVDGPSHGTLSGDAPNLVYTPDANYGGPDSFTFKTTYGRAESAVATVSISVAPINDAPVASDLSITTNEDTPAPFAFAATDAEGDALTYRIVAGPSHGVIGGVGPGPSYVPAPNYNGPDSFTYRVSDGSAEGNVATVWVTVNSVNDAPVAAADNAKTLKNISVSVAVLTNDGDADGDALTVASVVQPANGTVTISAGGSGVVYRPRNNFTGTDTFTYTASDGRGGTAQATVMVMVSKK